VAAGARRVTNWRGSSLEQGFSSVAGYYSQLAGVLAGFAFASLIALIIAEMDSGSKATYALQSYAPLLSTLISLIASSLNYAIIAGEKSHTSRAAALETSAGLGFSVAGFMLFFSLLVLLKGVEGDASTTTQSVAVDAARLLRFTMFFGLAPLMIILMYGGTWDHLLIKYGAQRGLKPLDVAAIALFVIVVVAAVAIWVRYIGKPIDSKGLTNALCSLTIGIAVASVALSTFLGIFMSSGDTQPDWLPLVELLTVTAFVLLTLYTAARYKSVP